MTARRLVLVGAISVFLALIFLLVKIARHGRDLGQHSPGSVTKVSHDIVAGSTIDPGMHGEQINGAPAAVLVPLRSRLEGQPQINPPKPDELTTTSRPPLVNRLGAATTKPVEEAQIVLSVLDAYRRWFGAYPAGEDNRQIMNALLGANAQKIPFVPADHPRLNANGELVDSWDTPFFFHLISRDIIEVRSAGPDRAMYTSDDIMVRTGRSNTVHRVIPDGTP